LETFPLIGQLKDETPPSAPVMLTGTSDVGGVAKITWQRNPEAAFKFTVVSTAPR